MLNLDGRGHGGRRSRRDGEVGGWKLWTSEETLRRGLPETKLGRMALQVRVHISFLLWFTYVNSSLESSSSSLLYPSSRKPPCSKVPETFPPRRCFIHQYVLCVYLPASPADSHRGLHCPAKEPTNPHILSGAQRSALISQLCTPFQVFGLRTLCITWISRAVHLSTLSHRIPLSPHHFLPTSSSDPTFSPLLLT